MDTAEKCASSLAINRKTAQSYYDRLRNHLAQENMRELLSLSGHEKNRPGLNDDRKLPVFWSLLQHNKIYIVFPETLSFSREKNDLPDVQGISEIYTNSPSARKNNTLDKFYRRTLWARKETDEKTLQQFWRQAKINLAKYRGGCKNNLPLFIVEMAFRFNYQEDEGAIHLLQKKIRESTPETYTEKIGR